MKVYLKSLGVYQARRLVKTYLNAVMYISSLCVRYFEYPHHQRQPAGLSLGCDLGKIIALGAEISP